MLNTFQSTNNLTYVVIEVYWRDVPENQEKFSGILIIFVGTYLNMALEEFRKEERHHSILIHILIWSNLH